MLALATLAWNIALCTAVLYLVILVGLRLAGKREIGLLRAVGADQHSGGLGHHSWRLRATGVQVPGARHSRGAVCSKARVSTGRFCFRMPARSARHRHGQAMAHRQNPGFVTGRG